MGHHVKPTFGLPTVGVCFVATLSLLVTACGPEYIEDDLDAAMQKETNPEDLSDVPFNHCGNGVVDALLGEDCDGDQIGDASCVSLEMPEGRLRCGSECQFDTSACIGTDQCGNGLLEAEEACDDGPGNEACEYGLPSCEICSTDCTPGPGVGSYCGDDVIDVAEGEQCDGRQLGGVSCVSLGRRTGVLSCSAECRFDMTRCDQSYCGDGLVQPEFEACDTALNPDFPCVGAHTTVELCVRCMFLQRRDCEPEDTGSWSGDANIDTNPHPGADAGDPGDSGGMLEDAGGTNNSSDINDRSGDESGCSSAPSRGDAHILWLAAGATAMVRRRRSSWA